jgi:SAM-dependent methyltransferase
MRCAVCGSASRAFCEMRGVPAHVGVLWPSRDAARACPRGDVALVFCDACGFISNAAFDLHSVDYSLRYDNALHFSQVFREYEQALARRLVETYDLRNKHVVEIGCGSGHFLGLVCREGDNRGTGYDPSHDSEQADPLLGDRATVVRGEWAPEQGEPDADLLSLRHVLEHISQPVDFLRMLRDGLSTDAIVYCEVPSANLILKDLSIWDVVYEHCNYFAPEVLARTFEVAGFEVLDRREAYQGQFASVEARVRAEAAMSPADTTAIAARVEAFTAHCESKRAYWRHALTTATERGEKTVIWGGGAKAVSFAALVPGSDAIEHVVDVNPGKQGSFLAGGGQEIVAPDRLRELAPDSVIVMNPVYREEIEAVLDGLGIVPAVLAV